MKSNNKKDATEKKAVLSESVLWKKMSSSMKLVSFDLELTARCNHQCRHCYISLPADDAHARRNELSLEQIDSIAEQAVSMGALWCLLTGGEPLLRKDFFDIYRCLKKKGLLLAVFTNATLITDRHISFFKEYPPRDIEVTVYGTTRETYERVTRTPGSFAAFQRGVRALRAAGIRVRFKAVAMRSNLHEITDIMRFCRRNTKDYVRFDPLLHLRFDGNKKRNAMIRSERLSPDEIAAIERADAQRFDGLLNGCNKLIVPEFSRRSCSHIFHCGAGLGSFAVSYDGLFRMCPSLWHPAAMSDLKKISVRDSIRTVVQVVRNMHSHKLEFLERCHVCPIINLCIWCPAHAYLETGALDTPVDYFCGVAHARAASLTRTIQNRRQ